MDIYLNQGFEKKVVDDVVKDACDLLERGILFMSKFTACEFKPNIILKEEFCIGSTLHRGCYNPSPVYDVIVGNTLRGRISKNPSADKVTHHYYFNRANELTKIDYINQNKTSYTEWLYRENNVIYGFTVDGNMRLSAISKELYQDGRLVSFALIHCIYNGKKYEFFKYHEENYQYDTEGLYLCNFINYVNHSNHLINKVYEFERRNGFLVSYAECLGETSENRVRYLIRKKRPAYFSMLN